MQLRVLLRNKRNIRASSDSTSTDASRGSADAVASIPIVGFSMYFTPCYDDDYLISIMQMPSKPIFQRPYVILEARIAHEAYR